MLVGDCSEAHLLELGGTSARGAVTRVERTDFVEAAETYRICRRSGSTIRQVNAYLIAGNALRTGPTVLYGAAEFTSMELRPTLRCADI